jgi:hypothetical protein
MPLPDRWGEDNAWFNGNLPGALACNERRRTVGAPLLEPTPGSDAWIRMVIDRRRRCEPPAPQCSPHCTVQWCNCDAVALGVNREREDLEWLQRIAKQEPARWMLQAARQEYGRNLLVAWRQLAETTRQRAVAARCIQKAVRLQREQRRRRCEIVRKQAHQLWEAAERRRFADEWRAGRRDKPRQLGTASGRVYLETPSPKEEHALLQSIRANPPRGRYMANAIAWEPARRRFYVPHGQPLEPFRAWLPPELFELPSVNLSVFYVNSQQQTFGGLPSPPLSDTPQSKHCKVAEIDMWAESMREKDEEEVAAQQAKALEDERRVNVHYDIVLERHARLWRASRHGGVPALERLCKANSLITSGRKGELLCRLVNTDVHGRPDRCPKCKSKLHLVCEPSDMQPNTPVRLKCHHWHFNPAGGSKPCGWEAAITAANKSSLLRLPLADSWEGDLASSCPAEADTAPTTYAGPPGAPSSPSPTPPDRRSPSRERVREAESEAGGVAQGKQDISSDNESIEICDEPPDDNDDDEMHEYHLPTEHAACGMPLEEALALALAMER